MSSGRKAYLAVAISLAVLGWLASIACFCVQPMPFTYLGLWLLIGLAWTRTPFLVAHVVTGAAFVLTHIVVFNARAGSVANYSRWLAQSTWIALAAGAATALIAFGTVWVTDRRRPVPEEKAR